MIVTWLCLLLMSFNVCKVYSEGSEGGEVIKATKLKTTSSIKDSLVFHTQRYFSFMRKCRGYLKKFLMWIKKHIKHGIKCSTSGVSQMRCKTKSGLSKLISLINWKRIPQFLRNRWTKTTITSKLYYRDPVGKQSL